MPTKKDLQSIRANDSPMQWSVWFFLFYPLAAPIYAITRRNWSVLANTLAFSFAFAILWEITKYAIKSIWSYDIDSNETLNFLYLVVIGLGISIVGYYSVLQVATQARSDHQNHYADDNSSVRGSGKKTPKSKTRRRSVQDLLSRTSPFKGKGKIAILILSVLIAISLGSYAIYTTTVETTIKSNPVLSAVAATGTTIQIKHFNCGGTYGYYDSGSDTLEVCTAVHDDQLFTSKESTIRHEAWHLVQACSAVKSREDEWGNLVLVNPPQLSGKKLTADESKYVSENYDPKFHSIENEAFLAEFHLTDGQIIKAIEEKCYFPE